MTKQKSRGLVGRIVPALLGVGVFGAVGVVTLAPYPSQTALAQAGNAEQRSFAVDGVHSSVLFRVVYQNTSHFYGRFNEVSGTFNIDPENPERTMLEIAIKVESVDSGNDGRDNHLRNPDFFNARQFPEATFKSTSAQRINAETVAVTGDLTIRGVTKEITFDVRDMGETMDRRANKTRAGFATEITINRSDFGISYGVGPLSDETTLIISLSGLGE